MLEPVFSCMLFYKSECGGGTGDLKQFCDNSSLSDMTHVSISPPL